MVYLENQATESIIYQNSTLESVLCSAVLVSLFCPKILDSFQAYQGSYVMSVQTLEKINLQKTYDKLGIRNPICSLFAIRCTN